MPYHITHSKSKTKPFNVVLVGNNGEPMSSHQLASNQSAWKNVKSQIKQLNGSDFVQDDTAGKLVCRLYFYEHSSKTVKAGATSSPMPRYIPGRNPKKKSK